MTNPNDEHNWKETFFQENFSVDQCLSRYTQKSDLETLRRELKNYGIDLQNNMSEILKTETEAIVNLAEQLTNLNFKIENLSIPICQLQEEILTIYNLIKNSETTYSSMLNSLKENNNNKSNIHLKLGLIGSSIYINSLLKNVSDYSDELTILERLVMKYSFEKNHMNELGIDSVESNEFVRSMEECLVNKINSTFLDSFSKDNVAVLTRCLYMYDNLHKQSEAERVFQVNVIRPFLQHLLTESNLEKHNQSLLSLYEEVLVFLEVKMKILYDILERNPDLVGYNFGYNSFWNEFNKQSLHRLPNITAPGNPDLFQKRFQTTWQMLRRIAVQCRNENLISTDDSFQEHLRKFNLPVYYEIRHQKIAGNFESLIVSGLEDFYENENINNTKIKLTTLLLQSVAQCYHKDIYLDQLADQFLKLSLMLLSRYLKWFISALEEGQLNTTNQWEKFVIAALWDLKVVDNFMACRSAKLSDIESSVFGIMRRNLWPIILKYYRLNEGSISLVRSKLKSKLTNVLSEDCLEFLQNVEAIPRLYRRTNRSAPHDASSYMPDAVKPIIHFHSMFTEFLEEEMNDILENVIIKVTKRYLNLVKDVLNSVCKTNKSLMRLKKGSATSSEESSPKDYMSDENKIRLQIKFDTEYFLDKVYPLGSSVSLELLDLLRKEIISAESS